MRIRPVERGERGESFPGPRDILGAPPSLKNTEKGVPVYRLLWFFLTTNMHKIHFGRGSAADPLEELTTLPHYLRPLVGW